MTRPIPALRRDIAAELLRAASLSRQAQTGLRTRMRRLAADFAECAKHTDENGCWPWRKYVMPNGYGTTSAGRIGKILAHRASYVFHVGPIPQGLHLDHLCRNRRCVNPTHLEPVTPRENAHRGEGPSGINSQKVRCDRGHLFADHASISVRGGRVCRVCDAMRARKYKAAKRSAVA